MYKGLGELGIIAYIIYRKFGEGFWDPKTEITEFWNKEIVYKKNVNVLEYYYCSRYSR